MYKTISISTGLYPNLDLWNANKLRYITLIFTNYNLKNFKNVIKTEFGVTKYEREDHGRLRHVHKFKTFRTLPPPTTG